MSLRSATGPCQAFPAALYRPPLRAQCQRLRSLVPVLGLGTTERVKGLCTIRSARRLQGQSHHPCASAARFASSRSSNSQRQPCSTHRDQEAAPDAEEAIAQARISRWISDLTSRPSKLFYDTIDVERASQLRRILPTRQDRPDLYAQDAVKGEILPCAHHLVYFRPKPMLRDLGRDGSATEYNAPPPYSRRMWAGGKMMWSDDQRRLIRVGDEMTQVVRVPHVDFKKDMIFVQQQISLYSGIRYEDPGVEGTEQDDWSVREIRTHVFRRPDRKTSGHTPAQINIDNDASVKTVSQADDSTVTSEDLVRQEIKKAPISLSKDSNERYSDDTSARVRVDASDSVYSSESQAPNPIPSITMASSSSSASSPSVSFAYRPDTPLLFLYSALTHNPHKVHYDHPWTINREGHPAPLVHGPLTATLLVELAYAAGDAQGKRLREFEYRATSPMVIDREINMSGMWSEDVASSESSLTLASEQGGRVGMKAVAKFR